MGSSCSRSCVCAAAWISCVVEGCGDYEDGDGERGQRAVASVVGELCVRGGEGRHRGGRAWLRRGAGRGGVRRRG